MTNAACDLYLYAYCHLWQCCQCHYTSFGALQLDLPSSSRRGKDLEYPTSWISQCLVTKTNHGSSIYYGYNKILFSGPFVSWTLPKVKKLVKMRIKTFKSCIAGAVVLCLLTSFLLFFYPPCESLNLLLINSIIILCSGSRGI